MTTTAKVLLGSKIQYGDGDNEQYQLAFYADYNDVGRNAEWAKYTPALSVTMMVKPEAAAHFRQGQAYTLTFTENPE